MCKSIFVFFGLAVSTSAYAQTETTAQPTRAETFQQIGQSLQAIQSDLAESAGPAGASNVASRDVVTPDFSAAIGKNVKTTTSVDVFNSPTPTARPKGELPPGTDLKLIGVNGGYLKIQPTTLGMSNSAIGSGEYFVPEGVAITAFDFNPGKALGSYIDNAVDTAIQDALVKASALADSLEGNPYVTMKGFSVQLTVPPGLNVDFEMK